MTTAREALEMAAEVCRALDDKSCARFPAYASGARECASRILALRSSVQEEPSSEPVAEVIEISDTMDSYTQRPPATRTIAPYKPISELPVGTKLYASTLPQSAQNNEGSLPARQPVGADVASASDPSPESAQNNAEAQHEVGNTQPEHGAAVSGPAAASAPFARNDSGKRKNTPIADLMAQYTAENCDFTDMDWVRKAAMLYVDRMEDCQVRCLLHALVSETQRSPDAWRYRYGKDGGWKYTEYKSDINPGKEYESQPLYAPSPSGVEEGVAAPEKRKA